MAIADIQKNAKTKMEHSVEAFRHNLTKITKVVKEGQSAEMAEGNRVHKAMEMRVKKHEPLPEDLQKYEPIAASLLRAAEGGAVDLEAAHQRRGRSRAPHER